MARFKIIPEVHLVLRRKTQLLFSKRANTGYRDGYFSLVAGHVDGQETFRAAMAREALEEVGLVLDVSALRLVHVLHRMSDSERVSLFFEVDEWMGEPVNSEPEKCDGLRWVEQGNWPDNTVPYIVRALEFIAQGVGYSEFGWD